MVYGIETSFFQREAEYNDDMASICHMESSKCTVDDAFLGSDASEPDFGSLDFVGDFRSFLMSNERKRLAFRRDEAMSLKSSENNQLSGAESGPVAIVEKGFKSHILCKKYTDIKSILQFGPQIGDGSSCLVRKCYISDAIDSLGHTSLLPLACKTISKSRMKSHLDAQDVIDEVRILQMMQSHESVVRLKGLFEDHKRAHLVMEYCHGGDLFSRIKQRGFYSEPAAAKVCQTIASVLAYAHSHGVMHRDIKPENILLTSSYSDTDVKIADFGSATTFQQGQKLTQLVGSPLYMAPWVLERRYGPEADLWSLGVVLYILLSGVLPFWGSTNVEIFSNIQFGRVDFEKRHWKNVSMAAKSLVSRLLNRDAASAMTAQQVYDDPWIVSHCSAIRRMSLDSNSSSTIEMADD